MELCDPGTSRQPTLLKSSILQGLRGDTGLQEVMAGFQNLITGVGGVTRVLSTERNALKSVA